MREFLIRCDGARIPPKVLKDFGPNVHDISHRGESPQLNINIRAPLVGFDELRGRGADLLLIASYAFAADQDVSRGGDADVYGSGWFRSFRMFLPVADPEFWNSPEINGALSRALGFVSDDKWAFEFLDSRKYRHDGAVPLELDSSETLGSPDVVALISGGLDSLASVIEQASTHGRRPVLVAHSQNFHIESRQRILSRELRRRFGGGSFPVVSAAVHRWKSDAHETSQRTRSFLYASIASAIASQLGIGEIHLADNGPVSVNLPINDQLHGAQATRSTHPRFIRLLNELLALVFPAGPQVSNPLGNRTRAEILDVFKQASAEPLMPLTNSCAHQRNRTASQPYCGICSQCIDRRFAVIATGLEEFDPPERYDIDVFADPLMDVKQRTLAFSFYRTALAVRDLSDESLWTAYPLAECIDPDGSAQAAQARELIGMLRRQSQVVLQAVERVVQGRSSDIALQRLSPDSFLAMVGSQRKALEQDRASAARESFLHSDDYRSVSLGGLRFALGEGGARTVSMLHRAAQDGTPDVAWTKIQSVLHEEGFGAKRARDLFRTVPNWKQLVTSRRKGTYRLNLPVP